MPSNCVYLIGNDPHFLTQLADQISDVKDVSPAKITNNLGDILPFCTNSSCDMIVVDFSLPDCNVLPHLRTVNQWTNKPTIILLSNFADFQIMDLSLCRCIDHLIMKPCTADDVVKIIRERSALRAPSFHSQASERIIAITSALHELGVPAHIKGYQYLKDAIALAAEDVTYLDCVTKVLYPHIAQKYQTSSCCVERAIRHAIQAMWLQIDEETIQSFFGSSARHLKTKPSNSCFIALVAERLQLQALAGKDFRL